MRYRITIEIEAEAKVSRTSINEMAHEAADVFVSKTTNPVFLSTEIVNVDRIELKRD